MNLNNHIEENYVTLGINSENNDIEITELAETITEPDILTDVTTFINEIAAELQHIAIDAAHISGVTTALNSITSFANYSAGLFFTNMDEELENRAITPEPEDFVLLQEATQQITADAVNNAEPQRRNTDPDTSYSAYSYLFS